MQYLKNNDISKTYNVSLRTVLNWILSAQNGRLDLDLYTKGDKVYIANTARNIAVIEKQVQSGKKYRNTRAYKEVIPKKEFYTMYNPQQVVDIISNLEVHHEIPIQYSYVQEGAYLWDQYTHRLLDEETSNILKSTIAMLDDATPYMSQLLAKYKRINIVDIGPGNGLPVQKLLQHYYDSGRLGRYITIDISPDMLEIVQGNIKKWFKNDVSIEGEIRDISYERITDLLIRDTFGENGTESANIVLLLGGTLKNFRAPRDVLNTIYNSLSRHDLLICSGKLDSPTTRRYFDFNNQPGAARLAPIHRLVLDMLNIDESQYEVEAGFNETTHMRYIRIRLKVALSISFNSKDGERVVSFNKDDAILLWRAWENNTIGILKQLEDAGFETLHASVTGDNEYLLNVHRIKPAPITPE